MAQDSARSPNVHPLRKGVAFFEGNSLIAHVDQDDGRGRGILHTLLDCARVLPTQTLARGHDLTVGDQALTKAG